MMRLARIPGGEQASFENQIKWLTERAQKRRDEMKDMLAKVKREAALMKEAKIKILKFPKMDEEVELLFKWNKDRVPHMRDDLSEVLKEVCS